MNKKLFAMVLSITVMLTTLSVSAATPIDNAKASATAMLPSGSVLVHSQTDNGLYKMKYYSHAKNEQYVVFISASTGELVNFETQVKTPRQPTSKDKKHTIADAQKLISTEIENARFLSASITMDLDLQQYHIRFQTNSLYGKYDINPKTGEILQRKIKTGKPYIFTPYSNHITQLKLRQSVNLAVPDSIINDVDLKTQNGVLVFEVTAAKNAQIHRIIINALTGELISKSNHDDGWKANNYSLSWDYDEFMPFNQLPDNVSAKMISTEKAAAIATAKAPKASVVELSPKFGFDSITYEGTLADGKLEYDFIINALTGDIIDWEDYS